MFCEINDDDKYCEAATQSDLYTPCRQIQGVQDGQQKGVQDFVDVSLQFFAIHSNLAGLCRSKKNVHERFQKLTTAACTSLHSH